MAVLDQPEVAPWQTSPASTEDARAHLSAIEQVDRALMGGTPVAIIAWPEERAAAEQLALLRMPRLLIMSGQVEPAHSLDDLEDWVRLPVADCDVRARVRRLRQRSVTVPPKPLLDGCGRLIYQGRWVELAPVEERLAGPLVERFGCIVTEQALLAAGWPSGSPATGTLRPRLSRLRRRVAELGLDLATVRMQGYCLQLGTAALH